MATRSFLIDTDLVEGRQILSEARFPSQVSEVRRRFSIWTEEKLLEFLRNLGAFDELRPILLGSWARDELCPKSDVDLLFLGDQAKVKAFVSSAFEKGLKLRSRVPADLEDWTVGVQPFDILALHGAKAFNEADAWEVERARSSLSQFWSAIRTAIKKEREDRRRRQDSMASLLQPNLKYGIGGLRDIEQALAVAALRPKRFVGQDPYPFEVMKEVKEELLFLRSWLHVHGGGEVLTAADQLEMSKSFGLTVPELMKQIQSQLERGSFYADWILQIGLESSARAGNISVTKLKTPDQALKALRRDPSLVTQFEIRRRVVDLHKGLKAPARGRLLVRALKEESDEKFLFALYRTRLLEEWLPDFKKLRGLVQHDHYHRYTADAHLIQTLREVRRAQKRRSKLGPMAKIARGLSSHEWWVLKLTALFHDLAKGREGDHSTLGARLVRSYFKEWGLAEALSDEVAWMVENHLLMSTAAFRQNPHARTTWQRLFERGVTGRRIDLLALFTALDIISTNEEAWTMWKAGLMADLVKSMHSPSAKHFQKHLLLARKLKLADASDTLAHLDAEILTHLPSRVLVDDLGQAARAKDPLAPKILSLGKGNLWIRFHAPEDKPGLFLGFVGQLFGLGLSIRVASIHTLKNIGVYDWFQVRTERTARQVAKWLEQNNKTEPDIGQVRFQSIELVAREDEEWIISFRGRDQRGLLISAARALADENLSIRWARVHTWGGQVEDVFSIRPLGEVESVLERLRTRFVT
ncbi:MAG: HD domain-containing protein [Bdellovibrionales bacterium]